MGNDYEVEEVPLRKFICPPPLLALELFEILGLTEYLFPRVDFR